MKVAVVKTGPAQLLACGADALRAKSIAAKKGTANSLTKMDLALAAASFQYECSCLGERCTGVSRAPPACPFSAVIAMRIICDSFRLRVPSTSSDREGVAGEFLGC